jgi:tetratricopeptide (TPR) repeat protein
MLRGAGIGLLGLLISGGWLWGDVLHLKDGRSLQVESWHYQGDQIVFEIEAGSVSIPRSLVERIEATSPPTPVPAPAAAAGTKPSGGTPSPGGADRPAAPARRSAPPAPPPPVVVSSDLSDSELQESLDRLKRDLRDEPRRRESDSREIARGLALLAVRFDARKDLSGAESAYREALTYDSRCLPALVGLSSLYLKQGKDLYARAQIQEGLISHPNDPSLHALLGSVYYAEENLPDAISEWETSLSLKADPRVASSLEKARRELAVDHAYSRTEAPHFTLRYEQGGPADTPLGPSIRDYLEEKYQDLAARFEYVPPAPIVVLLYPTREFHEMAHVPASVVGLFDGKIRVPIGGVKELNPAVRAVLVHELTHAFAFGKSGGNCPRWLQEGLAQLSEGRPLLSSQERGLARDLAASEGRSWYEEFSYPSSLSFTRYLEDRFGFSALVEALDRMRTGLSAEEALHETTRETFGELQKGWMEDLLKKFAERS